MTTPKHPRFDGPHQKELHALLRQVAGRHNLWQVWRDFMTMSACSLSNAVDLRNREAREAQYMEAVGRYSKEEAQMLACGFGHIVMGLEAGLDDFLGSLFMQLELGNSWAGQFFTPYPVCRMICAMVMGSPLTEIERKGFVTVNDPCVGGGAMIIAAADSLLAEKIKYQQHMHAVAQDIDLVAVHMAYIQLSLLHVPAVVIHGNSLAMETRSIWLTPAHVMGGWKYKLQRAALLADAQSFEVQRVEPTPDMAARLLEADPAHSNLIAPLAGRAPSKATPITLDQLALF